MNKGTEMKVPPASGGGPLRGQRARGWRGIWGQTEEVTRRGHRGFGAGMGRMQQHLVGKGTRTASCSEQRRTKEGRKRRKQEALMYQRRARRKSER